MHLSIKIRFEISVIKMETNRVRKKMTKLAEEESTPELKRKLFAEWNRGPGLKDREHRGSKEHHGIGSDKSE